MPLIHITPQLEVLLEIARPEDIDEMDSIERRSYPYPWTRKILLAEINGEAFSYVYVARLCRENQSPPGPIIAYHIFWLVADEVHILNIAVDPAYRGYGLATRLMRFAFRQGLEAGATSALLEVRPSNRAARALYENLGFQQIAVRKAYYVDKEDAIVMRKILSA